MCFYNDDGEVEFGSQSVVRARKPHKCNECRAVISAGESYQSNTGKYDGGFFAHKICRRCCYDIYRVVENELNEGCSWDEAWPPFDGLVEHLEESELGQTRPEDVPATYVIGQTHAYPRPKLQTAS